MDGPTRTPRIARIPRALLHVGLDHLPGLGVPDHARAALVSLLADLPLVPMAADDALLVGPAGVSLPCLAALARHVGQGLRDHNVTLMHDRTLLRTERLKLGFLSLEELLAEVDILGPALRIEAALFVTDLVWPLPEPALALLDARRTARLATFATSASLPDPNAPWRLVAVDER